MPRPYKPVIPQDVGEMRDKLKWMGYAAPTFKDPSWDEMFPGRDLSVVFFELKEGLEVVRGKLGEGRYAAALDLLNRMQALFEADPEDANGQTREGRKLIQEMEDLLKRKGKG